MSFSIESFPISKELIKEIEKMGDCFVITSTRLEGSHNWNEGFTAHNWQITFAPEPSEFEDFLVIFSGCPDGDEDSVPDGWEPPREELGVELRHNEWEDNSLTYWGENFSWYDDDVDPNEKAIAECLAKIMWIKFQCIKDKINAEYMKQKCKKLQARGIA